MYFDCLKHHHLKSSSPVTRPIDRYLSLYHPSPEDLDVRWRSYNFPYMVNPIWTDDITDLGYDVITEFTFSSNKGKATFKLPLKRQHRNRTSWRVVGGVRPSSISLIPLPSRWKFQNQTFTEYLEDECKVTTRCQCPVYINVPSQPPTITLRIDPKRKDQSSTLVYKTTRQ